MKPADIEKFLSEQIKWRSELEAAFRQAYDTYFSRIDKHLLST
ncbi:MAG: hypothetical protein ACYT04_45475 [Nostoc sp.]